MPPVSRTESEFYEVKANTPVTLSVTIGESNVGGTDVTFNGQELKTGGAITDLAIGAANENLKQKSIDCITSVKRVNTATNRTSVTYHLRGGVEDRDFTYEQNVAAVNDRAVYDVTFVFS